MPAGNRRGVQNGFPRPCGGRQAICHRLGCAVRARPHPVCVPDLSSGREHTMEHTADGSLPQTLSPTDSERQWAALAHLSALVLALMTSWIAGAAGVLAAVVVYMIKRDDSPFASGDRKSTRRVGKRWCRTVY